MLNCITHRRSGRNYNGSPISEEALSEILNAGLLSPSSRNLKSTELILIREPEMLNALASAKTAGGGMLKHADCAVVVIGNSSLSDAWIEDGSIAMTQMMLQAAELGVANCWVQIRNRYLTSENRSADSIIGELLEIPEGYRVLAVLSLGMADSQPEPKVLEDTDLTRLHRGKY